MAGNRDEYKQWPFLNHEEFDLACAYFDQKYVRAKMGPNRQVFKIRHRRALTTNSTYIEIVRLLQLPENDDDLLQAFARLGSNNPTPLDAQMAEVEDADEEALRPEDADPEAPPPIYSMHAVQPYVTYEVHHHPTYRVPTLWFTLHDLPMGEAAFDIEAVYRYLVPTEFKGHMRAVGIVGGISAAPHPLTDIPSFFVHPCQTVEALEPFECPMRDYILVWLGLVGGCIGLTIPAEIVQADSL